MWAGGGLVIEALVGGPVGGFVVPVRAPGPDAREPGVPERSGGRRAGTERARRPGPLAPAEGQVSGICLSLGSTDCLSGWTATSRLPWAKPLVRS
ncbi:hypothetical protein GCM10018792_07210 [Streptomyces rubradiris]|nr:hypothetical protein GCM10018792_07210 [Streptomyces rubradiris]